MRKAIEKHYCEEELLQHRSLNIVLCKLLNPLEHEVSDGCDEHIEQLLAWHAANLENACAAEFDGWPTVLLLAGLQGAEKLRQRLNWQCGVEGAGERF